MGNRYSSLFLAVPSDTCILGYEPSSNPRLILGKLMSTTKQFHGRHLFEGTFLFGQSNTGHGEHVVGVLSMPMGRSMKAKFMVRMAATCLAAVLSLASDGAAVPISSVPPAVYSGVDAAPNQVFQIVATGTVDLSAINGSYVTDADGTVVAAPALGSGAEMFFANEQPNVGVAPTVGSFKLISPSTEAPLPNGRYGILTAGFSSTLSPASYSDFIGGFTAIGAAGTVTAPPTGGYLFFAVNDGFSFVDRPDNAGSFEAIFVPEPQAAVLLGLGALILARHLRRHSPRRAQVD